MQATSSAARDPIRVIVAEHSGSLCRELSERCDNQKKIQFSGAGDWDSLKGLLEEERGEVIIVARAVGESSGFEINEKVKSCVRTPPATIMLAPAEAQLAIKAIRCGFFDFVATDKLTENEISHAVTRAAQATRTKRQRADYIEELENLAQKDGTTGLASRQYMQERLDQMVQVGRRHKSQFAAILIRLKRFKYICSAFGHNTGDTALRAFANNLRTASRISDTFGRVDDDTFLYLVDRDVSVEGIGNIARRLAEATTFTLNIDELGLALSPGIGAALYPYDGATASELLMTCGKALKLGRTFSDNIEERSAKPTEEADIVPPTGLRPSGTSRIAESNGAGPAQAARSEVVARDRDQRAAPRRRVLKSGVLVLNDGLSTVNCVIRDLSETGARVAVDGIFSAPRSLELLIVESRERCSAETRWQKGSQIGLMFLL